MSEDWIERRLVQAAAERFKEPWMEFMYRFAEPAMTPAAWRDAVDLARRQLPADIVAELTDAPTPPPTGPLVEPVAVAEAGGGS